MNNINRKEDDLMSWLDDQWKKIYKNDPEGYERQMKENELTKEKMRKKIEQREKEEKNKALVLISSFSNNEVYQGIDELSEDEALENYYVFEKLLRNIKDIYFKDDERGYKKDIENDKLFLERLEEGCEKKEFIYDEIRKDLILDFKETSKEDLVGYYLEIKKISKIFKEVYNRKIDQRIFSVSKIQLRELLARNVWVNIKNKIIEIYPDQVENIELYKRVYFSLLNMEQGENEDGIVIILRKTFEKDFDEETFEELETGLEYIDVFGMEPDDTQTYALDFSEWEDWIAFYCNHNDLEERGEPEFIAHVLWEMTFTGYTKNQVEESRNELVRRVEESKKLFDKEDDEG